MFLVKFAEVQLCFRSKYLSEWAKLNNSPASMRQRRGLESHDMDSSQSWITNVTTSDSTISWKTYNANASWLHLDLSAVIWKYLRFKCLLFKKSHGSIYFPFFPESTKVNTFHSQQVNTLSPRIHFVWQKFWKTLMICVNLIDYKRANDLFRTYALKFRTVDLTRHLSVFTLDLLLTCKTMTLSFFCHEVQNLDETEHAGCT